jgi:hypothetical protein
MYTHVSKYKNNKIKFKKRKMTLKTLCLTLNKISPRLEASHSKYITKNVIKFNLKIKSKLYV